VALLALALENRLSQRERFGVGRERTLLLLCVGRHRPATRGGGVVFVIVCRFLALCGTLFGLRSALDGAGRDGVKTANEHESEYTYGSS
jgi:hypothetical protein